MTSSASGRRWPTRVRRVPFWVGLASSLGCLADPPTFAPRGQIPPAIIAGQVDPPLGLIYSGPSSFSVTVPFRSEDVNKDLSANLFLDLLPGVVGPLPETVLAFDDVPAGNFEELRSVSMNVDVTQPGCHSLTLILTYVENLNRRRASLPSDESLAARVVWWLNIGDDDGETTMAECPGASTVDAVPTDR
ncbi:MAG TPA: hypothetical protein VMG12_16275 [Polyangiaceae bacterium]|nr:hypothetical protein [Polyangiaceae bacterium]